MKTITNFTTLWLNLRWKRTQNQNHNESFVQGEYT